MLTFTRTDLARVARLATAWGVVFAIVHVYWAAGGDAALGETADTAAAQAYVAFVAVLGLVGAGVAHRLGRRAGRGPVLLARFGGVALLLGVAVGTGRWLADWSLHGDGVAGVAVTLYFLVGGLLFVALGWGASAGGRPIWRLWPGR